MEWPVENVGRHRRYIWLEVITRRKLMDWQSVSQLNEPIQPNMVQFRAQYYNDRMTSTPPNQKSYFQYYNQDHISRRLQWSQREPLNVVQPLTSPSLAGSQHTASWHWRRRRNILCPRHRQIQVGHAVWILKRISVIWKMGFRRSGPKSMSPSRTCSDSRNTSVNTT